MHYLQSTSKADGQIDMTLPTSGPISLLQIADEFGGTAPHSLSEYYAAADGIPASGPISMAQFYGKSAIKTYQWIRIEFTDVGSTGIAAAAEVRLALNGSAISLPGSHGASSNWSGQTVPSAFDSDSSTYWQAGASGAGQWIGLYYNAPVNFNMLWLMPAITYQNINAIRVLGSNSGNSGPFTVIREFTGLAGSGWVQGQYRWFNL